MIADVTPADSVELPAQTKQSGPVGTEEIVSASIQRLDGLLNARVLAARSDRVLDARLRDKLTIKRRLDNIPAVDLEAAILDELARRDTAARR